MRKEKRSQVGHLGAFGAMGVGDVGDGRGDGRLGVGDLGTPPATLLESFMPS
jgi:hypothetical protein